MENKNLERNIPAALDEDALDLVSGGTAAAGTCRYCGEPLEAPNPGGICRDCKKKYTSANRNS